jgi:IS5 family transposase
MSLPAFCTQSELFSTAGLSGTLFAEADRYRLFAKLIYPVLVASRPVLEQCYCADDGRPAIEPVLLLGVSILQELDGMPDRQAIEMLRYHAGWNFALNRQIGDGVFHSTTLVNFRNRLQEHEQSALGFTAILKALEKADLISRQTRQRLDSTQMFGRVARMSRLDCVREALRLALLELERAVCTEARPHFWVALWERYVESQVDYRASTETLARKMVEAGADAWQLLQWLRSPTLSESNSKPQARLLTRVFEEQFEVLPGVATPLARDKEPVSAVVAPSLAEPKSQPLSPGATAEPPPDPESAEASAVRQPELAAHPTPPAEVRPLEKDQVPTTCVRNPHDPEATYSVKGQGHQKREHVGYKVQVAETVCEMTLAVGEPTRNFIVGMVTHPAHESDETGSVKMEQEQARMGLDKPLVQYVDSAYVSAYKLVEAQAEGRELIGPALPGPQKDGRFTAAQFQINVEQRHAVCPAGKVNTQCSRLVEATTGNICYRFEFSTQCHDCPLREQCLGKGQRHRSLVVGEHHTALQTRRQEQQTPAFRERMKHRNAIEGTQSELVRAHGLRRARYRGLAKVSLQNYFIAAACNAKRWIRREAWNLGQAAALIQRARIRDAALN